jgi:hypothetical protein
MAHSIPFAISAYVPFPKLSTTLTEYNSALGDNPITPILLWDAAIVPAT